MKDKIFIFVLVGILIFPLVNSVCEQGQININTASKSELQKIYQIGESRAEQIIQLRPFESLGGLTKVSGIAETRLSEIKNEGLACVGEEISQENISYENNTKNKTISTNFSNTNEEDETTEDKNEKNKEDDFPVKLDLNQDSAREKEVNSKDIKKPSNRNIDKDTIAKYGLAGFCLILAGIYISKTKRKYKNEFR